MSADPWEPWLDELASACDAGDGGRVRAVLEDLWRFPFHEEREREPERWDRLFALLMRLLGHDDARVRDLAYHYARIAMDLQRGPGPGRGEQTAEDRVRLVARRTAELLPALAPLVRSGAMSLLRCTDHVLQAESLADVEPQEIVREWIASFAEDPALALAARIAYLDGRGPWESAGESLLGCLDHADDMVRAYAARALGRRYLNDAAALTPPLPEMVALLTAREIERPGIAGPFFSNWYGFGMEDFERHAGVEVEDWFCTILANRRGAEPDTLPCSNGIDFFAHEVFGGRPGYVRRLLDMGHAELAVQAATEVDERIDGMEPLLVELADRDDAEICRLAAWYLAYNYRFLHPAGERRGFVGKRSLDAAADLFINLSPRPDGGNDAYAAVLYPPPGETFDAAAAAACLERVLPESMRGEILPYGIPGDDGKPGLYIHGRSANARYRCGALVELRGDVAAQRWERIRILWHGRPGAWRPEAPP